MPTQSKDAEQLATVPTQQHYQLSVITEDAATIQDLENYLTSLYQRGAPITHTTEEV